MLRSALTWSCLLVCSNRFLLRPLLDGEYLDCLYVRTNRNCLYICFKCYYDGKKFISFFSFRFWKCFCITPDLRKFELWFLSEIVYFEFKFWISQSAITYVQNWSVRPQRVGSREKRRHWLTSLEFQGVNPAYCICKVWNPETPLLHIDSAAFTRIAFLK